MQTFGLTYNVIWRICQYKCVTIDKYVDPMDSDKEALYTIILLEKYSYGQKQGNFFKESVDISKMQSGKWYL